MEIPVDSAIAIYTAGIGTGALLWNVFLYVARRARLKFSWSFMPEVQPDGMGTYLVGVVYLANTGERPLRIVAHKGLQSDGDFFYIPELPNNAFEILEPHDFLNIPLSAELLADEEFIGLSMMDASLKEHPMPDALFKEMKKAVLAERQSLMDVGMYETRKVI